MRWFLLIAGGLLPPAVAGEVLAAATAPNLARRLRRARAVGVGLPALPRQHDAPSRDQPDLNALRPTRRWLAQAFGLAPDAPFAAQAYAALAGGGTPQAQAGARDSAPGSLWHGSPVNFSIGRDDLGVSPIPVDAFSPSEWDHLLAAANEAARDLGARFERFGGDWFLRTEQPWILHTQELQSVAGASIRDRLAGGPDAARWRRLLTRVQMSWHEHPGNQAREARGELPLNGLWIDGGGAAQAPGSRPFGRVIATDPAALAWAHASAGAATASAGNTLEVVDTLAAAANAEHWGLWLEQLRQLDALVETRCLEAYAAGHASLDLVLGGAQGLRHWRLARSDRFRAWRRHSLVTALSEAPEAPSR